MKKTTLISLVLVVTLSVEVAKADFTFGTPTNLGRIVNSPDDEYEPCISTDGLSLFFASNRPGGIGDYDLYVATRTSTSIVWETVVNLGPKVNSSYLESGPSISADGLELYFASNKPGGSGGLDIYVTTRATIADPWGEAVNLGPTVNSSAHDNSPSISFDNLELLLSDHPFPPYRTNGLGGADIWVTTRASLDEPWETPVNAGREINSLTWESNTSISADGRMLFFQRWAGIGNDDWDIYMARRATTNDSWTQATNVGPGLNTPDKESNPHISADGGTLYFVSMRLGGSGKNDLWQIPILPIVDLNSDGIVDCTDMCIMINHWGENYSLCDVGPTPLGDGIVDIEDLKVLAEHLFEDYRLIAHWKLDEKAGNIAYNSAGYNDGICRGEPVWKPEGGHSDGALEFDGINDYVETDFVLDPADGEFSVFAWIQGGAPGQVIISQKDGTNWLGVDSLDGKLTGLGFSNDQSSLEPLVSEFAITDGDWHHVGIVVSAHQSIRFRSLYVDGTRAAFDIQPVTLLPSDGGMYIGCGKGMEPGSFFSGLIDDVRIYNRAVSP